MLRIDQYLLDSVFQPASETIDRVVGYDSLVVGRLLVRLYIILLMGKMWLKMQEMGSFPMYLGVALLFFIYWEVVVIPKIVAIVRKVMESQGFQNPLRTHYGFVFMRIVFLLFVCYDGIILLLAPSAYNTVSGFVHVGMNITLCGAIYFLSCTLLPPGKTDLVTDH